MSEQHFAADQGFTAPKTTHFRPILYVIIAVQCVCVKAESTEQDGAVRGKRRRLVGPSPGERRRPLQRASSRRGRPAAIPVGRAAKRCDWMEAVGWHD